MSNQLESAGHDLSDELWSARLLAEQARGDHRGAPGVLRGGRGRGDHLQLPGHLRGLREARHPARAGGRTPRPGVELAREAARRAHAKGATRPLWVAASVGPYRGDARGRFGVPGAVRAERRRAGAVPPAPPGGAGRRRARRTGPGDGAGRRRGRGAAAGGTRSWRTGVAVEYTVVGDRTRAGQPLEEAFARPPTRTRSSRSA